MIRLFPFLQETKWKAGLNLSSEHPSGGESQAMWNAGGTCALCSHFAKHKVEKIIALCTHFWKTLEISRQL